MPERQSLDTSWMDKAPCKRMTDLFFPKIHEMPRTTSMREARAKAICASCVYVEPCLEYALVRGESGIWGGTSEQERKFLPVVLRRDIG